jgi:hypothetical protein
MTPSASDLHMKGIQRVVQYRTALKNNSHSAKGLAPERYRSPLANLLRKAFAFEIA